MANVKPIPEGYHTITPFLSIKDAAGFIDFLKKAFDGQEKMRHKDPDGMIMHAEVRIGDSVLMLSEAGERNPAQSCSLYVYVPDVDSTYKQAVSAGATSIQEPANMFYGDRTAGVRDANGNNWFIGTHIEDVSPEELQKRQKEMYGKKQM